MNELILIEGVEQRRLEQVLRRVAGKELDREGSITELRMLAVFSVNKWFASPEAVYGRGVVTAHEENRGSNNYHIEVLEPEEGKIFFRKQEEGYLRVGDTVHIAMHRGLYGLLHVESVDINR